MKIIFLLILVLLQQISTLSPDKKVNSINAVGNLNKRHTFLYDGNILKVLKSKPLIKFITESHIRKRSIETVTTPYDSNEDESLADYNDISDSSNWTCPHEKKDQAPQFQNVVCSYAPGKIICQLGRFSFVVNHGDHYMDKEVVEKFITMAYQRYAEGDDCFDVAVEEKETTPCACYSTESLGTTEEVPVWQLPPVTVECTRVPNDKLKMCNPEYEPSEKIYQCKAKVIGLRKRSILHISVNKKGEVTYAKNPTQFQERIRKKREYPWPLEDRRNTRRYRIKSKRFNNDLDLDTMREEKANLYYHTTIFGVRNYTDICTKHYQYYPWCPQYITDHPTQCNTNTANTAQRHCREADCSTTSKCFTQTSTTQSTTESCASGQSTTQCTIEIITEEALLKPTKKCPERRKRYRTGWRRRRKLQKPMKLRLTDRELDLNHRTESSMNANFFIGRQAFMDSNLAEIGSQNVPPVGESQTTTCPPCTNKTALPQTANETATIQWCTITVPCNITTSTCETPANTQQTNSESAYNKQELQLLKSANITQENIESLEQKAGNSLTAPSQLQGENSPQLSPIQISPYNSFQPLSARYEPANSAINPPREIYPNRIQINSENNYEVYQPLKTQLRAKRMYLRKIPRLRRRHINRWGSKHNHHPPRQNA